MSGKVPPEGIYLNAALTEVRERTLARIERRRHRRAPILVGAILTATLVGGTAAAALVVNHPWTIEPSSKTLYQLYCVQGNAVNSAAYYSASFYFTNTKSGKLELDPVAACRTVWKTLAPIKNFSLTEPFHPPQPSQLLHATGISQASSSAMLPLDTDGYVDGVPPMAVCVRPDEKGAAVYVISAEPGETHVTKRQWQVRCEINEGFVYQAPSS